MKRYQRAVAGILAVLSLCLLCACGAGSSKAQKTYGSYLWPDSELGQAIPEPESKVGEVLWEYSDRFLVYVAETTQEQYEAYIATCRSEGFTEDYYKGSTIYNAYNLDGIYLSLSYDEDDQVMRVSASAPEEESEEEEEEPEETEELEEAEEPEEEEDLPEPEETPDEAEEAPDVETPSDPASEPAAQEKSESPTTSAEAETPKTSSGSDTSGVTPSFQDTMDSYEAFMEGYAAFMKKYLNSDDPLSMMSDYGTMMTQYLDFLEKIEAIDTDSLSAADYAYYVEVSARVSKLLAEIYD